MPQDGAAAREGRSAQAASRSGAAEGRDAPHPPGGPDDAPGPAPGSEEDRADALAQALDAVEVRRSRRRVRTVTAFREGGRLVVAIPARFTRTQEREWVRRMVTKLVSQEQRRRPSDEQLLARATELSTRYLEGRAQPTSVAWVTNQGRRWGSCTPGEGTIRISSRVRGMPRWVLDYVLLHELAHLLQAGHGPEFWALVERYPRTERARGFLEGVAYATDAPADEDDGEEQVTEP
ncbi:M48 family metallopeptidase [Actinotalea sp. BY-33]|uniref:M48 family metallopeptidase n=1 Tax=Actinotalea soli TaxID=2819234 RepID=A0A939RX14_9CELL|nr:M48 family metallopeptidase [Actinotalea soli]MBO1752726.1 M48 family metallopeptidase [Actinotalea soli]